MKLKLKQKSDNNDNNYEHPLKSPLAQFILVAVLVVMGVIVGRYTALAEITGGSPQSNATSRILSLYTTLQGLGYGSDTNTPDWGAKWNRISTAAQLALTGNATVTDVNTGKTFYSNTHAQQTGTYPAPGGCSTQAYHDNYGAPVTETTNCSLTFTTNASPVAGDDSLAGRGGYDPRTKLTWSKLLYRSGTTIVFSATQNTGFSWDSTNANNQGITAPAPGGSRTAIQLCSDQGSGWRLPTQKELMQVYIDGSYFNLTQPSNYFWPATLYSGGLAWFVGLGNGYTNYNGLGASYQLRCVR